MMHLSNRYIWASSAVLIFLFLQIIFNVPRWLGYAFIGGSIAWVFPQMYTGWRINYGCLLLLISAVVSIMTNDIPVFFKPWQRLLLLCGLMFGCSPLFRNEGMERVRRQIFMGVLWGVGVISVWSIVAYIRGTGYYIGGIVNGYMGITSHPNFLGFFALVTAVWFAALFHRCTSFNERLLIGALWAGCIFLLILTASRSALACGVVGSLVVTYLRYRKNVGGLVTILGTLMGVAFLVWPMLAPYTSTMQKKTANLESTDEWVAASRGAIWELRYAEIEKSPIFGIGAYSCDIELPNAEVFYSEGNGSIELGNSYLGLLSQEGWFGFLSFLLIMLPILWKVWRYATREQTPYAQLLLGLLAAIGAHMLFEGYLMTAGTVQCIVFWILVGCADQCDTVADYPIFWEKEDPPTPEQYEIYMLRKRQYEEG